LPPGLERTEQGLPALGQLFEGEAGPEAPSSPQMER
jgi:hypothetical protein